MADEPHLLLTMNDKPKNKAAQALGRIKSDKKTASCRKNGTLGGRPKKEPFESTYHRDGSVTIWDSLNQGWIRTSQPSDSLLATLSSKEREKIEAHIA